MQPFGRIRKLIGRTFKRDLHLRKDSGEINWWEDMIRPATRSQMKQQLKKEIEKEIEDDK